MGSKGKKKPLADPRFKPKNIPRKCLGSECNRTFKAPSIYHRLCPECRKLQMYRFYR